MPSCPWDSCVDHSRRPGLCEFPYCSSAPEPPPGRDVGLSGTTIVKDGLLSHVLRCSACQSDRVGATSADNRSSPCRWSGGGVKNAERVSWRPLREIVLSLASHYGSAELAVRHDLTAGPPKVAPTQGASRLPRAATLLVPLGSSPTAGRALLARVPKHTSRPHDPLDRFGRVWAL